MLFTFAPLGATHLLKNDSMQHFAPLGATLPKKQITILKQ
jgi:hypothetical protein